jgi:protein involved in polysaccharide export with SLBB domain
MLINLIMFLKGQRMSEVVLDNHGSLDSRPRWNRVRGFLLTFGLVVVLCGLSAARRCVAQAADQVENQTPSQQTGQSADQQTGQSADQQTGQTSNQQAMSAEQIIGILEQEPDLLASIKSLVAKQPGTDPGTVSDQSIYDRIRQDASLRDTVTQELIKRGYSTNPAVTDSKSLNTDNSRSTKTAMPKTSTPSPAQALPYENPDNPQVQRQYSPYRNLPSLSDLYTQFSSIDAGGKLRRFGSDAFLVGTGNANELPMDLPVGPDYVLGTGDNVVVNLWGGHSDRLSLTIDRQGQIALPEAGPITIDGLTIDQAQSAIQKALSTQYQGEHVEISLGRLRTVRVYVVGDVQRPGAYDVSSLSTPLSALYAAGGPTSRGSLRIFRQYRGKQMVREIDLYDFLLRGVRSNVDRLLPGDTIMVPPVGSQITVEGMVHRPAIYELNGEQGLDQVLDLAGGVLVSASLKQINVERIEAHQRRTMLSLQLPDNAEGVKLKLADFRVQGGDDVVISQILPYNEQAVYLEGHVYRPGKYPYRDGMTINDLLHSYQDVMPEPADHAELVRLGPPDFRPETTIFSLPDVLIGNNPIALRPFDLIRIFSRYEIDSPRVSIEGEVLRPGRFPMSQRMTLADLVRMAGGFKTSAYRDEADLSSYVVQNGQKVMINHSIVAVEKALEGDKSADVALKPGDVVSIRRLAGWQDIGASVTINGEVEHAGSYGIEQGERLSSVLRRAGGFRESAYPAAAVMERVQVRELGEQARQQMILRIENTPITISSAAMSSQATSQATADMQKSLQQQQQNVLTALRNHPASGRLVVNISADIGKWENTPVDIELRAGDTLVIPKRPNFVIISGQVFNPTAISYVPGRDVGWYLRKAGGATPYGNTKYIYVLRADGSVVPRRNSWTGGNLMNLRLRPGDTVLVPEKIAGGSPAWQNILGIAQIMSAVALPIALASSL